MPGTAVNGARSARVPNTTNIGFDRVEAESLLIALDLEGIAVSTGSACSSGTLEPSHVLRAMGLPTHRTQNSLRFSLGLFSTEEEVDRVVADSVEMAKTLQRDAQRLAATARGETAHREAPPAVVTEVGRHVPKRPRPRLSPDDHEPGVDGESPFVQGKVQA